MINVNRVGVAMKNNREKNRVLFSPTFHVGFTSIQVFLRLLLATLAQQCTKISNPFFLCSQ